ncbi:type IV secretion system protein [Anaplasmataceae bacterium AB001_6]|nr:type IV secretion system protein [Anaplasmataceae bacterium AB001_6]
MTSDFLLKLSDYKNVISRYLHITQDLHAKGACGVFESMSSGKFLPSQCHLDTLRFDFILAGLGIIQYQLLIFVPQIFIPLLGYALVLAGLSIISINYMILTAAFYADILLCMASVVKAPVLRNSDGEAIMCKNPVYDTIDVTDENGAVVSQKTVIRCPSGEYELANGRETWPDYAVIGSDYMEVCTRNMHFYPLMNSAWSAYWIPFQYADKSFAVDLAGGFGAHSSKYYIKDILSITTGLDPQYLSDIPKAKEYFHDKYKLEIQEVIYGKAIEHNSTGNYVAGLILNNKMFFQGEGMHCHVSKNIRYTDRDKNVINVSQPVTNARFTFSHNKDRKEMCAFAQAGSVTGLFGASSLVGCQIEGKEPPYPECKNSVEIKNDLGVVIAYDNSRCYSCILSDSCLTFVNPNEDPKMVLHSNWNFLAPVVGCFQGTLHNMVSPKGSNCATGGEDDATGQILFFYIQDKFKDISFIVTSIAIAIFGYRVLLFMVQDKKEIMVFAFKLIFITYMTMGDGVILIYDYLLDISTYLVDSVVSAGNTKICNFDGEISYPYFLSPWDKLDCRLGAFLGGMELIEAVGGPVIFSALTGLGYMFMVITGLLFAGSLASAFLIFFYTFFMVAYSLWATKVYMVAIVCLSLLALIAPIPLLMGFFSPTKDVFNNWYKMMIGYTIYPTLIMAFVMIGFGIFDNIFLRNIPTYERVESKGAVDPGIMPSGQYNVYSYQMNIRDCDSADETVPICTLIKRKCGVNITWLGGFTTCELFANFPALLFAMLQMCIMIFLFYHFTVVVGTLTGELVGSFRSDLTSVSGSPHDTIKTGLAQGMKGRAAIATATKRARETVQARYQAAQRPSGTEAKDRQTPRNNRP